MLAENPGIFCFVWEDAEFLEWILFCIEEMGFTVSGAKLTVCVPVLEVLGHMAFREEGRVAKGKQNKVLVWPKPQCRGPGKVAVSPEFTHEKVCGVSPIVPLFGGAHSGESIHYAQKDFVEPA